MGLLSRSNIVRRTLTLAALVLGLAVVPGCSWFYGFHDRTGAGRSYSEQYRHDRSAVERMEASEPD
jgi:hypothetical protein